MLELATCNTHRALKFHFVPLEVSYKLFQIRLDFFLIKCDSTLQLSSATKCSLYSLFEGGWKCATLHSAHDSYVSFENWYKCLAEQLLLLKTCVSLWSNEVRTTVSIAVKSKNLLPVCGMIKPVPRVIQSVHPKQLDSLLSMLVQVA